MQRSIFSLALLPVVISLTACGSSSQSLIEQAAEACDQTSDDGTLVYDTKGEDDISGDDLIDAVCVLVELEVSDAVIGRIDNTRALDGVQTADVADGQVRLSWSYQPDSGMFMAIEPAR